MAPSGDIIRILSGQTSMRVSNDVFHPGPNTILVSKSELLFRSTTIGNMPSICTSVTKLIISPVAISIGSPPGDLHELPREAVFDAFCADFSPLDAAFDALDALDAVLDALDAFDAVLDALDIAFAGFAPLSAVPPAFNALSAFPPGTHVATSKANSSNEQLPVSANMAFKPTPTTRRAAPIAVKIGNGIIMSNPPIVCNTSEIMLRTSACSLTQSLKSFHFSSNQPGFSSKRFLACDRIEVTAEFTAVLRVDLMVEAVVTSALKVVVARVCSVLAASKAVWAAVRSVCAVAAALAVATFTPGTTAVAAAVVVAAWAVTTARARLISHAL